MGGAILAHFIINMDMQAASKIMWMVFRNLLIHICTDFSGGYFWVQNDKTEQLHARLHSFPLQFYLFASWANACF